MKLQIYSKDFELIQAPRGHLIAKAKKVFHTQLKLKINLCLFLPCFEFKPGKQLIAWVKEAYGK